MVKIASPRSLNVIGVDSQGRQVRISREAYQWILDTWRRLGGDTDAVAAAQATAENAENAASYASADPGTIIVRSDASGTFPAGNPSYDLTVNFYEADGTLFASRVLRGTLNSSAGTFSVTAVSDTGTTSYVLSGDGTDSVRADVTATISATAQLVFPLAWNAIDSSVSGTTPAAGASK